jgi:Bacterial PH domain
MSRHDKDFDFDPVPGLPERLPANETILWQGRPDTLALAREALGLTWVGGYFVFIAIWRAGAAAADLPPIKAAAVALPYLGLGLLACLVIYGIALIQSRATLYTVTTARVAMRIGVLTITLNIPHRQILSASLDLRRNGTGTIAFTTPEDTRLSYLVCWPHVRPWRMRHTEPALRCIPEAAHVARILAEAVEARQAVPVVTRNTAQPDFDQDYALATG